MATPIRAPDDWGELQRSLTARRKSDGYTPTDAKIIRPPFRSAVDLAPSSPEDQARIDALDKAREAREQRAAAQEHEAAALEVIGRVPRKYRSARREDWDFALPDILWRHIDGVFLTGNVGIGKTRLATALALERAMPARPLAKGVDARNALRWESVPMLLVNLRSTFNEGSPSSEKEFLDDLARCDTLVLDDLGAEKVTEYTVMVLYALLAKREDWGGKTIVTTNLSTNDIGEWGPRLATRLNAYLHINLPDYDYRAAMACCVNGRR